MSTSTPAAPIRMTPKPAVRMWPWSSLRYIGSSRLSSSSSTSITRLNTQLPSASPTAMLGAPAMVTELTPVMSSGSEVAVASSTSPTQERDTPVSRPMMSPY